MKKVINVILAEPVRAGAIATIVAVVVVGKAFGVSLTPDQEVALAGLGLALLGLAEGVRKVVSPVKSEDTTGE